MKTKNLLLWPIWPLGWLLYLILKLLLKSPNDKTIKIAILGGSKGCGKSELWNQLRGTKNPRKPTEQIEIKSFVLGKKKNGEDVTVETTKDLGGGDLYVSSYEEIINSDDVFIYFLIDLRSIKKDAENIRARLRKIGTILKKHKNCGVNIIGTFYDKYRGVFAQNSKEDAKNEILRVLAHKPVMGIDEKKLHIHIINTTNNQDIEEIRNEILKTLE